MDFIKMHGAGNDYVYIDCFTQAVQNPSELAVAVSHRRFGIGSDGLILIKPCEHAHAEMEMYNADGSRAEMCGNGLRCVAKYVHDTYRLGEKNLNILTGNGVLSAAIHPGSNGKAEAVTIDMGLPVFNGPDIPTTLQLPKVFEQTLEVGGQTIQFSSVSMGNPHCVVFVNEVEEFPVSALGPLIEKHPLFPAKVNVEFVQHVSKTKLIQRTWERGSGETWACGTGASAVAVVAHLLGKTGKTVDIQLTGGTLSFEYTEGHSVLMTGPAVEVFRGVWPI